MNLALTSRVEARNCVNYIANEWHGKIAEAFGPLCGKKVRLANGDFSALTDNAITRLGLPHGAGLKIKIRSCKYTLWCEITVRATVSREELEAGNRPGFAETEEFDIGELDRNGVLWNPPAPICDRRTDYTVAEIVEKRRIASELKKSYKNAIADLSPFGESDYASDGGLWCNASF